VALCNFIAEAQFPSGEMVHKAFHENVFKLEKFVSSMKSFIYVWVQV